MEFTAGQVASLLGGRVEGNSEVKVSGLAKIEEGKPGSLTFLANPKYESFIYNTKASVVVVSNDFAPQQTVRACLIRVDDPYSSFAKLLEVYQEMTRKKPGIETGSFVSSGVSVPEDAYIGAGTYISAGVRLGKGVIIYPNCFIGENAEIGDQTTLCPGVKVYNACVIGKHCMIHAGVVIGADGFGFAPASGQAFKKVAQIGNVIIEDHVEVGANTTIDRATLGSTIIRKGVKLDNLIQVAHNVEIGENTVIAAQTGIAGSAKIGKDCMIGGQVGIVGHITIADKVKIAAQSGVGHSILEEGEIVQGSPAFSVGDYKRTYVLFRKLPELEKRITELEQTNTNHHQK